MAENINEKFRTGYCATLGRCACAQQSLCWSPCALRCHPRWRIRGAERGSSRSLTLTLTLNLPPSEIVPGGSFEIGMSLAQWAEGKDFVAMILEPSCVEAYSGGHAGYVNDRWLWVRAADGRFALETRLQA